MKMFIYEKMFEKKVFKDWIVPDLQMQNDYNKSRFTLLCVSVRWWLFVLIIEKIFTVHQGPR